MAVLSLARRGKTIEELEADEDFYPSSDGEPLAETDYHALAYINTISMLRAFFHDREGVYVAGNNFIYFERGNKSAVVSPDAYVVFGAGKETRKSYKLWEENSLTPNVVIEFTSNKTKKVDTDKKRGIYAEILRVPEYFLFDPQGDYLKPRLIGLSLHDGEYREMKPNRHGRLVSRQLGLEFYADGYLLRIFDSLSGKTLKTHDEALEYGEEAVQLAEHERREKVEFQLIAEHERREAENERREAEHERRKAEHERREKEEFQLKAETEIRELKAKLAELQRNAGHDSNPE